MNDLTSGSLARNLLRTTSMMLVGLWYDDFRQTTDEEVTRFQSRQPGGIGATREGFIP